MEALSKYIENSINESKNVRLPKNQQEVVVDEIDNAFEYIFKNYLSISIKNADIENHQVQLQIRDLSPSNSRAWWHSSVQLTDPNELKNFVKKPDQFLKSLLDRKSGWGRASIAYPDKMFTQKNLKPVTAYKCQISVIGEFYRNQDDAYPDDYFEISSSKNSYQDGNVSVKIEKEDAYAREGVTLKFTYTYPPEWLENIE